MIVNISIEARMTSTRLPGKVLKKINGIPALELMIKRIQDTKYIDNIIVATTTNKQDDEIILWCKNNNTKYFRGSEDNVYDRVLKTHQHYNSDIVIELTGDCPLLQADIIEKCLEFYKKNDYDYISNSLEMTYPIGMAVQVYSLDILQSVSQNRILDYQDEEHVTPHIYSSKKYNIFNIKAPKHLTMPELSVTLDTIQDFTIIENICKYFNTIDFTLHDIISYVKNNNNLLKINENIKRKGLE